MARVDAAESTLKDLPTQWSAISTRMDGLDQKIKAGLQNASRQSREMAAQVTEKLQTDFSRRFGLLDERVVALQVPTSIGRGTKSNR
jgi:hypothetical protein